MPSHQASSPQPPSSSAPHGVPAPNNAGFLRRHAAKLVASAVITAGLVYTLRKGGLKFVPDSGSFADVKWWTLAPYFLSLVGVSYFRAVRWRFLLRAISEVPKRRLITVSWIGFAAILLMPFRLGEIVRPYMLREKGKVSMASATGSVVAERVVDGLFLSVVLAIALIFVDTVHPLPQTVVGLKISVLQVRSYGFTMLGVFATAFIVIAVFYFARAWAHRATLAVFGVVSKGLAEKLASMAEKLADGLHFLGNGKDAAGFLAETTAYWLLNALGMWLLAWGCGVAHADGSPINFGETCALMGMLGVTVLIPGPPGLIGVFQAGVYAGMTMYFPTSVVTGPGAAYVFLLYAIQVGWTVVAAIGCLATDKNAMRMLEEAESIAPPPAS